VSRWGRRRAVDPLAGSLDPEYPPRQSNAELGWEGIPGSHDESARVTRAAVRQARRAARREAREDARQRAVVGADDATRSELVEMGPSWLRRTGRRFAEGRRRVLPLPDEVIDQFLGNGERMIYNDHPSFRSFMVENTLLFVGFLILAVLFLATSFNGSLAAGLAILFVLTIVLLALLLRRLGDRYTSYVVTDTRIMRISGIISRRAHSIPWVRVTDLTIEQSLVGRLFGYATLHIESANEDSGLRDLEGVSDPMQFNQAVVDMVVAKQGATEPEWARRGESPPVQMSTGLRRIRMSRRRRGETEGIGVRRPAAGAGMPESGVGGAAGRGDSRHEQVGDPGEGAGPSEETRIGDDLDEEDLDAEELAAQMRAASASDVLRWRR
jgi:membrane protein YdbS with pleckstrin-like domain